MRTIPGHTPKVNPTVTLLRHRSSHLASRISYLVAVLLLAVPCIHPQASAIPSAQTSVDINDPSAGRKLLDQMIAALGGPLWLNRVDYSNAGQAGTFYKGTANPYLVQFERYIRLQPFAERQIIVSKQGVFIPTTKRDVAEIWTGDKGYEVTYKGKKDLPQKDVDEFYLYQHHSLDTVVLEWLKQPGVLITYEGTEFIERKVADKVSILTTTNDGVTLDLDQTSHLPISLTFQWRDPTYHDFNTEVQEYDDYHPIQGIMTPLTLTRFHNGDMTTQVFLKQVHYNVHFPADLFNPDRPLKESAKK
ncbi:MAG TPA: hypothetical protein VMD97_02360 [Candidatus Aquilonibacter sp.]|nr:hypothetical protein [Candidatus Aquilonibacter sp.]